MTIKESIDKLIKENKKTVEFIENSNEQGADDAILNYISHFESKNYNSALSLSFSHLLQFCSDPKLSNQFENQDILNLLNSFFPLANHYENIYVDSANFIEAFMNNKIEANRIIELGITKLEFQLKELQELKKHIDS